VLELSLGSVFAHRFVIEKRMQSGGMGLIFRARDRQTNRAVALKLLQRESNSTEVDRFMSEARTLSELRHPAIVSYIAHGISSEGQAYLVMEWLEGEDLAQRLRRMRMVVPEIITLLGCVASALQVAHQAGVVHRDIKPSNLFLRNGQVDQVTLIDFGLARRIIGGSQMSHTGVVVGTPEYMAPEQARGDRHVGPSADIFSLGCVIFECLTGQPPFVSEHIAAVLAKILFEEAPPLNSIQPELPEPVCKLVARMLAKNPGARIADASALLSELGSLGEIPVDPKSVRMGSSTGTFEMAGTEQALVSVVIAQSRDSRQADRTTLDPMQGAIAQTQNASVRDALVMLGVTVECMVDGSLIATIVRQGAATDQAIHAARCALLIKERWPDAVVALGTGRAVLDGTAILGEVLGRVGMMLETVEDLPGLAQTAVRIDDTTGRLIDTFFAITREPNGQLFLTGLSQSDDDSRPLLGVPTQCVGRERELSLLEASFGACCDNSAAAVVLVSSPPGFGKSRLRHEFLRRLKTKNHEFLVLTGRGDPMSGGASYGLLAQALRRLFGIIDGEEIHIRQDKIRSRVAQAVSGEQVQRVSEFLGEMCGTQFPESILLHAARQEPRVMGDQVAQAFTDFLSGECNKNPVLLLLEDLHWGDALTVKVVDGALRDLSERPLMVMALARPEIEDLFPKLWTERSRQDIRLGALSKRACERLIQQVLGPQVAPAVQTRIIDQAAGNALFLEELVRTVAAGKGDELPETVLAILHARLMRLQPEARRILRTASVFGETCWAGGVRRLLGRERAGEQFESWLQILVEAEILGRRKESRFAGEVEYVFRHGLLREAAYGMLPDDERRLGHYLVGCYLEELGESDPTILAEHFQRSGDLERAIILYTRAAERCYDNNDLEGALKRVDKGLGCGAEGETRGALYALKTAAWFWSNDLENSFMIGNEALSLLATGTVDWCRAIVFTTGSAAALGKRAQVSDLALRFGTITPAPEILGTYMIGASVLAIMLGFVGDREMSDLFLSHLRDIGEPIEENDPHARACMRYALGRCTSAWPAVQNFRLSSGAYQIIGDRRMIVVSLADLGLALARIGATAEGEAKLREALPLAVRLAEPITLTWPQMYLALLLAERPDPAARSEAKQLAQSTLKAIGESSYYSGIAYCALAAVYRAEGNLTQAEEVAQKAVATLRGIASNAPLAFIALGRLLLSSGRNAEAARVAAEGVEAMGPLRGVNASEVPLRMLLVESLRAAGDAERAAKEQEQLSQLIALRAQEIPDPVLRDKYLARVEMRSGAAPLF